MAFVTDAPYRLSPEGDSSFQKKKGEVARSLMWLIGFADDRGKVMGMLNIHLSMNVRDLQKKPPHFPCRKVKGAAHLNYLIF